MNLDELVSEIQRIPKYFSKVLLGAVTNSSKVIIIGNGGSNAIASHIAVDYRKFLNKRVDVLTDTSMLSMLVNDYDTHQEYAKFIEMNYESGMLVILISSSGNSPNIVNALLTSLRLDCNIVCLSGFDINNKLYTTANTVDHNGIRLNYHVNSNSYGVVENTHQILLHSIIEN